MKSMLLLLAVEILRLPFYSPHPPDFIDPTGTYTLKGTKKNTRILGHSGELRVKLLAPKKVAMCFYINKGYPGYESGSFLDTLAYEDNLVKFIPNSDGDCSIIFCFSDYAAEIRQVYTNPQSGCGFGEGILVSAFFEKSSEERPIIQDLSKHGISPTASP